MFINSSMLSVLREPVEAVPPEVCATASAGEATAPIDRTADRIAIP
jgi:hypothetical protein